VQGGGPCGGLAAGSFEGTPLSRPLQPSWDIRRQISGWCALVRSQRPSRVRRRMPSRRCTALSSCLFLRRTPDKQRANENERYEQHQEHDHNEDDIHTVVLAEARASSLAVSCERCWRELRAAQSKSLCILPRQVLARETLTQRIFTASSERQAAANPAGLPATPTGEAEAPPGCCVSLARPRLKPMPVRER
jgi:hypothetical protein